MADETYQKIETKLAALREIYLNPDEQARITDTEKALRRNILKVKLAKHLGVQDIVKEAIKAVHDIDFILCNDNTLTTEQRLGLFAEKKVHKFWLQRIDGESAKQAIGFIEETVDSIPVPGK